MRKLMSLAYVGFCKLQIEKASWAFVPVKDVKVAFECFYFVVLFDLFAFSANTILRIAIVLKIVISKIRSLLIGLDLKSARES